MKWSITIHRHINTHFFYLINILLSFAKQFVRKQYMNVTPSHDNKFIDLKIIILKHQTSNSLIVVINCMLWK